jgi:hypothetical protein
MITCIVINQLLEAWERSAGTGRLQVGAIA